MLSARSIGHHPVGIPLAADELVEFHAARILLLIELCGVSGRIDGLTKLAKLDFFVRYPVFFNRVLSTDVTLEAGGGGMIRYRYGPWDPRYYQVLPFLEARGLISVERRARTFVFRLSEEGQRLAGVLKASPANSDLVDHMAAVKRELGRKSGNALKELVYATFEQEISNLPIGTDIR